MNNQNKLLVITGPTATGKTRLAALLSHKLGGEIISADSRQVFKSMDIGTGKDIEDYIVDNEIISSHLIDILNAGEEYNVFRFQRDFLKAYLDIKNRNKLPVLCGGTGMYIESVLAAYKLPEVPINENFRNALNTKTFDDIKKTLMQNQSLHNTTDLLDKDRAVRALEILHYGQDRKNYIDLPDFNFKIFAIQFNREVIRERITERLKKRLQSGMIEEVISLLDKGLTVEQLNFYGLEYRYLAMYINKEIDYAEMFRLLNTAIHQFAKRQMTWFRRMEKKGFKIQWIDGSLSDEEKINIVISNSEDML